MEDQEKQIALLDEVMKDVREFAIAQAGKKGLNPSGLASGFLMSIESLIMPNISMLLGRDDPKSATIYLESFQTALREEVKTIDKVIEGVEKAVVGEAPEASNHVHIHKIQRRKS